MMMRPTSRNTLMIGGALILIALLLVCGPLTDRLGSGGSKVEEPPAVAAGPPVDAAGALGAAAAGALAGATLGDAEAVAVAEVEVNDDPCQRAEGAEAEIDGSDCPPVAGVAGAAVDSGVGAGVVAAGVATAAGVAAVAVAADGIGGGSSAGTAATGASASGAQALATPPPVSAGVPATNVSGPAISGLPVAAAAAAWGAGATAGDYDDAIVSARNANGGVGPAGRIVDRFAPPVAAPASGGLRVASALSAGPLILPCDTPGSGCRNIAGTALPPGPGPGVNPPIVPGGPPTLPQLNNPPIVPGSPPQLP